MMPVSMKGAVWRYDDVTEMTAFIQCSCSTARRLKPRKTPGKKMPLTVKCAR